MVVECLVFDVVGESGVGGGVVVVYLLFFLLVWV